MAGLRTSNVIGSLRNPVGKFASPGGDSLRVGLAACWKFVAGIATVTVPGKRRSVCLILSVLLLLAGCGGPQPSTPAEIQAFREAGPVRLQVDIDELLSARQAGGPYRLVPGDVLELQMPEIVRLLPKRTADETTPYRCRVDSAGMVILPIIGEVNVAGQTLAEVEKIAELYHPRYVLRKPSIVASVAEYHTACVSIVGAVRKPGTHQLRSNEMGLITGLMKAGGISQQGASAIHIHRADQSDSIIVPVAAMTIPSRDVPLRDGDTIVVEGWSPQSITVIGLVKKPGLHPWRQDGKYSVMDALASAGGVNELASPQYVKIYRKSNDGKMISATLKLEGPSATGVSNLYLKPGDVVAVESTAATRTRLFLMQIVRMGVGVNAGANVGTN